ncbi:hypothetical protein [Pseudomonas syringae]|uniref:Uncharacterized protein n=1 Tax=Pseudomonas syringae CC1417 TaxID=1357272 RepID=A0AAU8LG77_PSESX
MSGYEQILDVYEANHQALYERRKAYREAFLSFRQALNVRLGIPKDSEKVALEADDGSELLSVLLKMEHGEAVKARAVIELAGRSGAPNTKFFIPLQFKIDGEHMTMLLPTRRIQVIAKLDDYNEAANFVFDYVLNRLADY